jgi:hypothetical protein
MALITSPEAAARLARPILTDIALYNKEKVKEGIKNDTLFETLEKELKEGLDLYNSKVDPGFLKKTNFFNKAIVDVLVKRSGDIESEIW